MQTSENEEDQKKEVEEVQHDQNESTESETFINCAGHLQYLKSKLHEGETIIKELESAENINEEYFLIKLNEFAKQVKESSNNLLKLSSKVLEMLYDIIMYTVNYVIRPQCRNS